MRRHSPPPGRGHTIQRVLCALPARARVSGRDAASKRGASLLEGVGLGGSLVRACGRWHVRLEKELLQALLLVRADADIVVVGLRNLLTIENNEGEAAAMILN